MQEVIVSALSQQGYRVMGKKAGATNAGSQATLGLDEAVYGILFDAYQMPYGESIYTAHFIKPVLECEIAFKMKQSLAGPNVTIEDVVAATETIVAAFEIVDFRVRDLKPGIGEAISYNVFASRFVLGQNAVPLDNRGLAGLKVTLTKNGEEVETGSGQAVLENPLNSVAWLANKIAQNNGSINTGDIILTGSTTVPHPIAAGDQFEAVFEGLETLSVQFD